MKKWLLFLLLFPATLEAQTVRADRFTFNTGPCVLRSGSGSPETVVTGNVCDTFWRTDTGQVYTKMSGTGNTGWFLLGGLTGSGTADTVAKWTATTTLGNSTITDAAGGNLTMTPAGDIVTDPVGNDILPNLGYDINLGMLTKKYLTLHAAELWVETLVAQNTLATIGGRIIIAPTSILSVDLAAAGTTLTSKYNNLANGDRIYMEADGKVEFMAVTSGAGGGVGAYTYSVTRNLDGSGANDWFAGDALVNTGQTGNGFMDLYSVRGVKAGTEIGPTIVGNIRQSSTYNDWIPGWVIGNLNGLYGYSSNLFGAAFGHPSGSRVTIENTNGIRMFAQASATGARVTLDASNGLRIYGSDNDEKVTIDTAGNATFDGKVTIGTGRNVIRNSECRVGTEDWVVSISHALTTTLAFNLSSWNLNNESATCYITVAGTPAGGTVSDVRNNQAFPVVEGLRYEVSVYVGSHRTNAELYIAWRNSAGTEIAYSGPDGCTAAEGAGGVTLAGYCRMGVIATAPSGAITAKILIRAAHTNELDPYLFWVRAYFGEASSTQEDLTEWGPAGITEITNGLIKTDAIDARTITADSITTSELAADSVTSAKIVAGTIVASDIAADTITASQIATFDLSAISANLGTITAGSISGVTATFGGSGGTVTLNSSGISITSGSDNEDKVKWDDGSNIRSASDQITIQADGAVTILGPSFINLDTSGGDIDLDASNTEVTGTLALTGTSTTTDAHWPLVLNGSSNVVAKTDGFNGGGCSGTLTVEYGLVVACSGAPAPAPAPDLELAQRVSDLEAQIAQLYAQLQALTAERRH